MMNKNLVIALSSLLLAACATIDSPSDSPIDTAADAPATATEAPAASAAKPVAARSEAVEPEPIKYGNFTEDQLFQAIISELGAQRGYMQESGENYFDLAFETRDLEIIRRAVQFASANGDGNALLQLGLLWTEVAPDSPQPHLMLAYEFLEAGNFEQAISHMARVIDLGGDIDFTALASRTGQLDPALRGRLIENIRQLSQEFTTQRSVHLTLVQLLAQNQQYGESLQELSALVARHGNAPLLVRLQAQILQSDGQSDEALRSLRQGVREFPEDRPLRFALARQYVQVEDYRAAREEFQVLVDQDPTDWETWYSMGLLDLELENYERAARTFTRLVGVDERADESQYYLGFIYEQLEDFEQAIEHYRAVRIGTNNYLNAQQQATRLSIALGELDDAHAWLSDQSRGQPRLEIRFTTMESGLLIQGGHPDEAGALLDRALNKYPNEVELLFARVLLNDSRDDLEASEKDLRQILLMQPDNANYLNHLGYMLADRTDRYEEALELLEQAIALDPDNPAIIDSLGWAQYKLGHLEDALYNLRRAFAAFPDPEVAAHLGEVLWALGEREEATDIWRRALSQDPESEHILDVLERFQPEL
jgi:tetratricopeptide (TPR) repeat protein